MDFVKGGDVVIPFEQGGGGSGAFDSAGVHVPDRVEDGMVVGVEGVLLEFGVTGDVDLGLRARHRRR